MISSPELCWPVHVCERDEEEFAKQCFVSKRHKQEPQWKYLKEIFQKDKRVEVDEILKKILDMDKLSRDNNIF